VRQASSEPPIRKRTPRSSSSSYPESNLDDRAAEREDPGDNGKGLKNTDQERLPVGHFRQLIPGGVFLFLVNPLKDNNDDFHDQKRQRTTAEDRGGRF